jgi:hypothetical protein
MLILFSDFIIILRYNKKRFYLTTDIEQKMKEGLNNKVSNYLKGSIDSLKHFEYYHHYEISNYKILKNFNDFDLKINFIIKDKENQFVDDFYEVSDFISDLHFKTVYQNIKDYLLNLK